MASDDVLNQLLDHLWHRYCKRVEYARRYRDLTAAKGGRVVNDHIAFRTVNTPMNTLPAGIEGISRVFVPLGYKPVASYEFPDKYLVAKHFEHPAEGMPRIFISQLQVDELPEECAILIRAAVNPAADLLDISAQLTSSDDRVGWLADSLSNYLAVRPWRPPLRSTVEEVNRTTQYGAWVLLYANNVNHFTAYVNDHGVKEWPDIEATVAGLVAEGIPMKDRIEGERGSRLRQSSTQAIEEDRPVLEEDGSLGKLRWPYAYYELAERGMVPDPDGKPVLFGGFLGSQATHLFDMTTKE